MSSKRPRWRRWRKWKWLASALLLLSSIAWAVSVTRSIRMRWSGPDGSVAVYLRQGALRVITTQEWALEDRQIDAQVAYVQDWAAGAADLRLTRNEFRMTMWLPPVALLVPTAVLWWLARRPPFYCCQSCGRDLRDWDKTNCPECGAEWTIPRIARLPDGRCSGCGYDLSAVAQQRCPECGLGFDPDKPYVTPPNPLARWAAIVPIAVGIAFVILLHQSMFWGGGH